MKIPIACTLITSLVIGSIVFAAVASDDESTEQPVVTVEQHAALEQRLAAIEARQSRILDRLEKVDRTFESSRAELSARLDEIETRREVASERKAIELSALPEDPSSEDSSQNPTSSEESEERGLTSSEHELLDSSLATIFERNASHDQKQDAWNRLRKAGLLDAAIAEIQRVAEENPDSAQAQADLGSAYIQKIFDSSNDLQKGLYSMKANKQYDAALALDEQHWEARFSKAVNWSFNPPIMGLQPKAIEQFEILRTQQERQEAQPQFAQTYLYLGNLYLTTGKPGQAAQVWSRGAELFPNHSELREKAASAPAGAPGD